MMMKRLSILAAALICIFGLFSGDALALPDSHDPARTLTLTCGTPQEFDSTRLAGVVRDIPQENTLIAPVSSKAAGPGSAAAVPEPATVVLLGAGLCVVFSLIRRKRV
jgi:hypothetical protein